ncbi:hypothetical protein Ac2012v2_007527 [Leucoagaricus gongylophorus]
MLALRAILLLAITVCVLALDSGFYNIQSVASRKNIEAQQQGLPLFAAESTALFFQQDYTVWQVVKHGHNSEAIYTLQNNATKLYAQVYHETFNATLMVAEKIATPLELEYIGEHEWMIRIPGSGTKSVWTIQGPSNQISLNSMRVTRKGIPRVNQRFKFKPVQRHQSQSELDVNSC